MAKGRVAMLTGERKFEIREFDIPKTKDDEILIKVEGCGVCGTDGHEYKRDPFGLIPVVLGHEGTGEIIEMGANVKTDTVGKPVAIGDKLVTSVLPCGKCNACTTNPGRINLCEGLGVYGLIPDDETHFNGYFGDYMIIRKGSTFYNVSDMDLDLRLLVEPSAVAIHAVERAKTTGLLNFGTKVLIQGCGPIGLLTLAVVRTMGVEEIIAIDGNNNRLGLAREMGATHTFNFNDFENTQALKEAILGVTDGLGAGFAFQCTGVAEAASNIWKFVRRGGGLCEVGFFVNGGDATINPHFDMCNKEITAVGSWVYTPEEYPITFAFLKRADGIGLPIKKLLTHRFALEELTEALETNLRMDGIKVAFVNR